MSELIEIGKVSSRGQIAIPSDIRNQMNLKEGSRVLFVLENDTLVMKRITSETFEKITKPLRAAKKKIKESDTDRIVHKLRKK